MRNLISILLTFVVLSFVGIWIVDADKANPPVGLIDPTSETTETVDEASTIPEVSEEPVVSPSEVETSPTTPPLKSEPKITEDPMDTEDFGQPSVEFSSLNTMPGEFLTITLSNFQQLEDIVVENLFGVEVSFFEKDDKLIGLLPISYKIDPSEYALTIYDGVFLEEFLINVENKEFATQDIVIDESITSETVDNAVANNEYNQKIEPLKRIAEDTVLWDGIFIEPLTGYRLTSDFGEIRTVNQKPSGRHGGIDLAAPTGTPIIATNGAKVLFAENIILTGNTVILEHGLGLKSYYYHMDSLAVATGDIVEKGDPIGTVGTTGFSTGPHLHYAMSIGTVYINPWTMFSDEVSFN